MANFAIDGALITGTAKFGSSSFSANGTVAATFTATSAPTGAATAIQGWLKLYDATGNAKYVPHW